jgi:hypothetical protein
VEDTRRDRMACVEAKQVAVAGHPSYEENRKTSKFALEELVSLVLSKGSLVFWMSPYILTEWMDGSQLLEPYLICFSIFLLFSLVFPRTSLRASCEI